MPSAYNSFFQLIYEIALTDTLNCINYALVLYEHVETGVYHILDLEVLDAIENVGLIVHKFPVVYRECFQVYNDTVRFVNTFYKFELPVFYADVSLNVVLNFIDIYLEAQNGIKALQNDDYGTFGIEIGKITSDVFLKNPLTLDWTFNNSEVFKVQGNPQEWNDLTS